MVEPVPNAIFYLSARGDAPWRWADRGAVVTWSDGTTIAFREEIIAILEGLIPQGWPPFGALVWLLAACRGKLPPGATENEHRFVPPPVTDQSTPQLDMFEQLRRKHAVVEQGLLAVAQLPPAVRSSPHAKSALAEAVFADSPGKIREPEFHRAVLEGLRSGTWGDVMLNAPGLPPAGGEWMALYGGLVDLTPEKLALRTSTGLEVLPGPAKLDQPLAMRVREVLADLRSDIELAGFARLVRDLMAAVQLPRRLSELDEMPLGGFADITNRGDPDRLLLSELAHDDLTLAVRIALNEALYLRREPPAKQPPGTLAVLLDSGVRLWGLPRVFATAAALAFVAKSADHEQCVVSRASGSRLESVDLLSKTGLIAHLGALEPTAHPGLALSALRARLGDDPHAEALLVTHPEVLADPDFQRDLANARFEKLYLAAVDRDGSFRLERHPRGGPPLAEARMNLNDLFPEAAGGSSAPKSRPLIDRAANPELPLILSLERFPLFLPVNGVLQKSIFTRHEGGACVTRNRQLLAWTWPSNYADRRGAHIVAHELPRGTTLCLEEHDDGSLCVVKTVNRQQRLAARVYHPEGGLLHSHDWQFSSRVLRVESQSDAVFILFADHAEARDWRTGEVISSIPVPGVASHGRYFRYDFHQAGWQYLAWNGQALRLEPVIFSADVARENILRVFRHRGLEGPWVVQRDGKVRDGDGAVVMDLGQLRHTVRISDDGRRLVVASAEDGKVYVVDLHRRHKRSVKGYLRDADWASNQELPTCALRKRFYEVAISDHGCLRLSCARGWMELNSPEGKMPIRLEFIGESQGAYQEASQRFVRIALPGQPGFSLAEARWSDGRRAWLDDRGLLHLRCANKALPEVTIVLVEGSVTVWSSDGLAYGDPFFIGDHQCATAAELWKRIQAFTVPA